MVFLSVESPPPGNPCQPSPCGPNSECREKNGGAACSCLAGYKGAPPACRPECVLNTDCPDHLACIGQKCLDPCEGECGQNARCTVRNHSPVCRCNSGYTGDPFQYCSPIPKSKYITLPRLPQKVIRLRLGLLAKASLSQNTLGNTYILYLMKSVSFN